MDTINKDEKYRILVENATVGIYIVCENKFIYANDSLAEMFAYTSDELLKMHPLALIHENDQGFVQKKLQSQLKEGVLNVRGLRSDGEIRHLHVYGRISNIDETEKKIVTNKLEHLANYDSLTQLNNRHYFNISFEHIISKAERYNTKLAILLFDIDNFKRINDSLGHKAGDLVLVKTAELVGEVLRESDSFYRIGGDEFTVIMENFSSTNEVKLLVKRIQQALRTSIEIDELSFHISLSIGIAIYPEHGRDTQTLQKSADVAVYQAKKDGKNCFSIFAKDSGSLSKILELEDELYEGIDRGEIEMFLQPQVDTKTKKLIGVESLARWRHPKRGILTPGSFLPLAKEMGLLYKLDQIMIENAFLLLRKYDKLDMLSFSISVNISNALFHHQRFFSIMQKFQRRFTYLCQYMQLELTEDKEQVEVLQGINCDIVQGCYFAKPMCTEDFENQWLL